MQGKERLREFITRVFQSNPPQRKRFKRGFFTDGRALTWEERHFPVLTVFTCHAAQTA